MGQSRKRAATVNETTVKGVTVRYIGTIAAARCPNADHAKVMPLRNLAAYHAGWCADTSPQAARSTRVTYATPEEAIAAGLAKRTSNAQNVASILDATK